MSYYSIGDVAERCGINPVTLRAWQRRYGLLKPHRTEGGHRQFDESDIQRIEQIKQWIKSGIPVGKVKALLDSASVPQVNQWTPLQEEMMLLLRQVHPGRLYQRLMQLGEQYPVDALIDNLFLTLRQRLSLDHTTARTMCSLLDGCLIQFAVTKLVQTPLLENRHALLMGWENDDRTRLWLEAVRLSQQGWHIDVMAEPLDSPRPELFPGQTIFVWTGKVITHRQQELLAHWKSQGYSVCFHQTPLLSAPLIKA